MHVVGVKDLVVDHGYRDIAVVLERARRRGERGRLRERQGRVLGDPHLVVSAVRHDERPVGRPTISGGAVQHPAGVDVGLGEHVRGRAVGRLPGLEAEVGAGDARQPAQVVEHAEGTKP